MTSFPPLNDLGRRIMVLGPTNAGKSTLTEALAERLQAPAIHLDQYRHLPHTNWVQRPDDAFAALHDAAIDQPDWIMDGSYSKLMPQRLRRATGIIVLDETLIVRTWRYLRRSMSNKRRPGGLEGHKDGVSRSMLMWLWKTRNASSETRAFATRTGLPHVFVHNRSELDALYAAWHLKRPG